MGLHPNPYHQENVFPLSKKEYEHSNSKTSVFKSIYLNKCTIDLTVVLRAFNAGKLLPQLIDNLFKLLEPRERQGFSFEIIIVDDNSKDDTNTIVKSFLEKYSSNKIRLLSLSHTRGPGGAAMAGVVRSRGEYILFTDAKDSLNVASIFKLEQYLGKAIENNDKSDEPSHGIAVGSRRLYLANSSQQHFQLLSLLNSFAKAMFLDQVTDPLSGLMLFTRESAKVLHSSLHLYNSAYSVELLYVAEQLNIALTDVEIKVNPIKELSLSAWINHIDLIRDLIVMKICYTVGWWHI